MKRILALCFVVALAFTVISGCASTKEIQQLQQQTNAALQQAQAAQQECQASVENAEAAASRAEAAADRAEAMANKVESIFMRHMRK
jgi:hypothetical protein